MNRRRILLVVAVVVAALGLGLVFVYAQGADNRAKNTVTTTQVLVATQEIQAGESAEKAAQAGKIVTESVPTSALIPGATNNADQFLKTYALVNLYPGEQLIPDKFGALADVRVPIQLPVPKGDVAITVTFSDATSTLGPYTPAGSPVAMLITGTFINTNTNGGSGGLNVAATCVLLPSVDIIAVGQQILGADPNADPNAATGGTAVLSNNDYTLALPPADAFLVRSVQNAGTLSLALLSDGEKLKEGESSNGASSRACTALTNSLGTGH